MQLDTLRELNAERAARRPVIVVTDTANGEQRLVKARDFATDPLRQSLSKQLRMGKSAMVEADGRKLFLNVYAPIARMVIVGAVHISQALAPLARSLGYDVTVVDPRTAFASPERFPDVPLIAEWPDVALPPLNIDHYTAFVALTHDPKIDDPALAACFCARLLLHRRARFAKDARQTRRAPESAGRHRWRHRAHSRADWAFDRRGLAFRNCGVDHGRDHREPANGIRKRSASAAYLTFLHHKRRIRSKNVK